MPNDQAEKKRWELEQCQLVAKEMHNLLGTDYEAEPGDAEPADVTLRSKSGAFPSLQVQVVSIPLDFRHRDDKHSVQKIREVLAKDVPARGLTHCSVGLVLSGEAAMRGIKHDELETLINIILSEARPGNLTLRYEDILERSEELAKSVHNIVIWIDESIPNIEIDIPEGGALPPDGRWIIEGILKKVDKYGGANAVKELVLVIGVAGFVDDEQVQAFREAYLPDALPFAQIWIVTPFDGVICLKGPAN